MTAPLNPFFAAGLFDNPWVILLIFLGSALANWLSKRRAEKQAEPPPADEEPASSAGKPAGDFDMEEVLRRLLGEKPPAPEVIPPPLLREATRELPPEEPEWITIEPETPSLPPEQPPLVAVAQPRIAVTLASERRAQAAWRFEQLNEQGRHPATVVGLRSHRERGSAGVNSRWRDPRSARQAFVASLVFAPPKGLEP